jgi:gamma-glutamylcyclotransferase (GGCT)/AIG2-like uncharacterized protein YtfP
MHALYFAYGSNLSSPRMRERVPSARSRGVARLDGLRLALDKPGRDGTAKANLRPEPGGSVWGVVWALDPGHWPALDACERGYRRVEVAVSLAGASTAVATYVSELRTDVPVPSRAYKRFLVDGAREHGLPAHWVALLEALPAHDEAGG